jgi:HSP20 family protein
MMAFMTSNLDDDVSHEYRMDLHENAEAKTVTATLELPDLKQQDDNLPRGPQKLSDHIWGIKAFREVCYMVQERS